MASNLVPGDNNNVTDVFMHDRSTGNTARISVNAGGAQGNGPSFAPSVSATGQIVSFHSSATNLVPADNNNVNDVFRFDVVGLLDRVSINNGGGQGNGASTLPAISADGSMIAFQSTATNLVAGDVNGVQDVFVHDFVAGTTVRASIATGGAQPLLASAEPAISGDGTMVAFHSRDLGLVPGFGNTLNQVYVRSLVAGTTVPVSTTSAGLAGNGKSLRASLDETGQFIAFESDASDLVTNDLNVATDAFVRDLTQPGPTRVSLDKNGVEANGSSVSAALSRDGRYVAFSSQRDESRAGRCECAERRVHPSRGDTCRRVHRAGDRPAGCGDVRHHQRVGLLAQCNGGSGFRRRSSSTGSTSSTPTRSRQCSRWRRLRHWDR